MTNPTPIDLTAPATKPKPEESAAPNRYSVRLAIIAVLVAALMSTASELCLKVGATETAAHPVLASWLGISGLQSKWVWFGILFTILGFFAWIKAIRAIPLSIAFTAVNVVHVFIPLSCWLFLGETISTRRWFGIALVIAGLAVIAKPFAELDEKLEKAL